MESLRPGTRNSDLKRPPKILLMGVDEFVPEERLTAAFCFLPTSSQSPDTSAGAAAGAPSGVVVPVEGAFAIRCVHSSSSDWRRKPKNSSASCWWPRCCMSASTSSSLKPSRTYPHARESIKPSYGLVYEFWSKRFTILLKVLCLE